MTRSFRVRSLQPNIFGMLSLLVLAGCSLFEPREPEEPSQSSSDFQQPTIPEIVISNLKSAIAQKNVQNYASCFSSPSRREFTFIPSPEALARYSSEFSSWDYAKESAYMQNLTAHAIPNGFSSLLLTQKDPYSPTSDSVIMTFDYTFTFQHSDQGFPATTAQGELQFTLSHDNASNWSIHKWVDLPTGTNTTWSSFKGWFSSH